MSISTFLPGDSTTSCEIRTTKPPWNDVWELYHPPIGPNVSSQLTRVNTNTQLKHMKILIFERSAWSLPFRTAVVGPFCCCWSLQKQAHVLQDSCGVAECWLGTGTSLIAVCFGGECQLSSRKVKIQTRLAKHTQEVEALKRAGMFCYIHAATKIPWLLFSIFSNVWLLFSHTAFTTCPLL